MGNEYPFVHLVSARDRHLHFKFLHRINFTPAKLANIQYTYQSLWSAGSVPSCFSIYLLVFPICSGVLGGGV